MEYVIPNVWYVNKNDATPLFKQLADNIRWSIAMGNIGEGWKLPPVRVLAKELGVGVDTVRAAYKLLEEMGLIITRPHHGSQVVGTPQAAPPPEQNGSALLRGAAPGNFVFKETIESYLGKGQTEESIRKLFEAALEAAVVGGGHGRLIYIDDVDGYRMLAGQMAAHLGVGVDYMTREHFLEEMEANPDQFKSYQAVVTCFFHYSKILQACQPRGIPVHTIVTEFSSASFNRLARLAPGARVGMVCLPPHSREYLTGLIRTVRDDLDIRSAVQDNPRAVAEVTDWAELFVVTPPCDADIRARRPDAEILLFCDTVNAQSLGILRIQNGFAPSHVAGAPEDR